MTSLLLVLANLVTSLSAQQPEMPFRWVNPVVLQRLADRDVFLMTQFAHFLDSLRTVQDGDESLLDRTIPTEA